MYIYNVTTQVNWPIHEAWVKWMKEKHIPAILNSGYFTKMQFVRLLEADDSEGPTYAAQFYTESLAQYNDYLEQYAPLLRKDALASWGENFISFRSILEVVH